MIYKFLFELKKNRERFWIMDLYSIGRKVIYKFDCFKFFIYFLWLVFYFDLQIWSFYLKKKIIEMLYFLM